MSKRRSEWRVTAITPLPKPLCASGIYETDADEIANHVRIVAWALVEHRESGQQEVTPVFLDLTPTVVLPDWPAWQNAEIKIHSPEGSWCHR